MKSAKWHKKNRLTERRTGLLREWTGLRRCLSGNAGFSLTELLTTVLIVSVMSIAVVAGVGAAQRSLEAITQKSNSEILLSTTVDVLRDELRYVSAVSGSGSDTVTVTSFKNHAGGGSRKLINTTGEKGIALYYTGEETKIASVGTEGNRIIDQNTVLLVGQSARTEELYAVLGAKNGTDMGITYDATKNTFTVARIAVYRRPGKGDTATPLAELTNIVITPVNASIEVTTE